MKKLKALSSIAVFWIVATANVASAGEIRVVDGDTLERDGVRIRLWGIDAPEGKQTCKRAGRDFRCGLESAAALRRLIQGQAVHCIEFYRDRYNRPVSQCKVGEVDVARVLVRQGWAFDYERYSSKYYAEAEAEARANGRGLWAGSFVAPWEWRKQQRGK